MTDQRVRVETLAEWETKVFPGVALSREAANLAQRLRQGSDGRLEIVELRQGLQVSATSWVGVVRLDSIELRIIPKLAGAAQGLLGMLEITRGLEGLRRPRGAASVEVAGSHLFDLIVALLVDACSTLVRQGLHADYVEREDQLQVVRGRLDIPRQALEWHGRLDRLFCQFDEHEFDVPENQFLAAALVACGPLVNSPRLARQTRDLGAVFETVCAPMDPAECKTVRFVYQRLTERYREAHELAALVLRGLSIDDLLKAGTRRAFAFLLDMNRLFEEFMWRVFERILRDMPHRVEYQLKNRSIVWHAESARPYASVIPDLVVRTPGPASNSLPVDVKYKAYGERRKISPEDVYQLFLYAHAFGKHQAGSLLDSALLVYPSKVSGSEPMRLQVRRQGAASAEIVALGCHIQSLTREVQGDVFGDECRRLFDVVRARMPALGQPLKHARSTPGRSAPTPNVIGLIDRQSFSGGS